MVYLNVLLTANDPADAPLIADALRRAGALSKQEPGCLRWEAYQSNDHPQRFLLVERWETAEALAAHRSAKAYTEIYAKEVIPRAQREGLQCTALA